MGILDDAALTGKIKTALLMDERIGATGINVNTIDGVVTLEGTVPSEVQRELAAGMATRHGARAVRNVLEIESETGNTAGGFVHPHAQARVTAPPGAPPSHHPDLEWRVRQALAADRRVNEHLLFVDVAVNMVILSGRQGTVQARDAAVETTAHVPGVVGVEDEIEIMPAV